jgi:uncharacterized protein (TIGR02246 family)
MIPSMKPAVSAQPFTNVAPTPQATKSTDNPDAQALYPADGFSCADVFTGLGADVSVKHADPAERTREATAAIKSAIADVEVGWNTGDADKVVAATTRDVSFVSPYGDVVEGRDALKPYVQGTIQALQGVTHAFAVDNVRLIKPDVALVDESVTLTGLKTPDGQALPPLNVKASTVWVQSKGEWLAKNIRNHVFLPHPG